MFFKNTVFFFLNLILCPADYDLVSGTGIVLHSYFFLKFS